MPGISASRDLFPDTVGPHSKQQTIESLQVSWPMDDSAFVVFVTTRFMVAITLLECSNLHANVYLTSALR